MGNFLSFGSLLIPLNKSVKFIKIWFDKYVSLVDLLSPGVWLSEQIDTGHFCSFTSIPSERNCRCPKVFVRVLP